MNTDRHDTVAAQINERAAQFIQQEANTDPLITVTRVTISPDYRRATVFITTIPDSKEEEAKIFCTRKARDFRTFLKQHGRLKFIPHVDFEIDRGERHRQHLDEVVRRIDEE